MKLSAYELKMIICNTNGMTDYLRNRIGSALCERLYDPANSEEDYPEEYVSLYDASNYNRPDNDFIFLCFDYICDVLQEDEDKFMLELDLD